MGRIDIQSFKEKAAIAFILAGASLLLYLAFYVIIGDYEYIRNYVLIHFAFLPIHALVLSIIIEEFIRLRTNRERTRKLNIFLGIFFRQMGMEFDMAMLAMVENREELEEIIVVSPDWDHKDFEDARQRLSAFPIRVKLDRRELKWLFSLLHDRESEIVEMTRNPNLLQYEEFYKCLVSLFHLIEETQFQTDWDNMSVPALEHLAGDVGRTLSRLLSLWLSYLEFLKETHPRLFDYKVGGVLSTVEPAILGDDWDSK